MYGIFTYIWLILMVNVAKYTSPMDPMGLMITIKNVSQVLDLRRPRNCLFSSGFRIGGFWIQAMTDPRKGFVGKLTIPKTVAEPPIVLHLVFFPKWHGRGFKVMDLLARLSCLLKTATG